MNPNQKLITKTITVILTITALSISVFGKPAIYLFLMGISFKLLELIAFKINNKLFYIASALIGVVTYTMMFREYGLQVLVIMAFNFSLIPLGMWYLKRDIGKAAKFTFNSGGETC